MNVLGVAALRGRFFTADDSGSAAENVAILSYSSWHDDFGGDETVLGRIIPIDGLPTRIVGIMPRGYDIHDERIELFLPLTIDPKTFANNRGSHFLYLIAPRKASVSAESAPHR